MRRSSTHSATILSALRACAFLWLFLSIAMLAVGLLDLFVDGRSAKSFLLSAAMVSLVAIAGVMALRRHSAPFTPRSGFLTLVLSWTSVSLAGATPFLLALPTVTLAGAVFESVSGLTTTGSTVLTRLDSMPAGILVWRSLLQWIGGLGIIALGLFLLPFLRVGGVRYIRLESSEPVADLAQRLTPFLWALVAVYFALTALCAASYAALGMTAFDAVNHAMTTISTGGFSTHDLSMGAYASSAILWTSTAFMLASSLPFSLYVGMLAMRARAPRDAQTAPFLIIALACVLLVALARAIETGGRSAQAFAENAFNVVSVLSTTGFATGEYQSWGPGVVTLMLIITFFGGCAGSTSGGVKTYRLLVMLQAVRAHLSTLVYPSGRFPMRYAGRALPPAVFASTVIFMFAFFAALATLTVGLGLCGLDVLTSFTGALTALTNVGPGLGPTIGPVGNFSGLPEAAKVLLAIGMLLGRLELIAVLVVASPAFWRR